MLLANNQDGKSPYQQIIIFSQYLLKSRNLDARCLQERRLVTGAFLFSRLRVRPPFYPHPPIFCLFINPFSACLYWALNVDPLLDSGGVHRADYHWTCTVVYIIFLFSHVFVCFFVGLSQYFYFFAQHRFARKLHLSSLAFFLLYSSCLFSL